MKLMTHSFTKLVVPGLVIAVSLAVSQAPAADAESSQEKQRKLISVLQSDAPPQDKAITCKKLAIYGTQEAVPALAPLLMDPELASWARTALEAIPDPVAGAALREAMGKVQGRLLVGVINSIGVRRDAQAVSSLVPKLQDGDAEVAAAAAAALGNIGGEPAAQALQQSLARAPAGIRAEVAEGCIRCAERFLAEGKAAEAVQLYDSVRQANVPKQKLLEAIRGAILARQSAGLPLLLEQLKSADKARFGIGLRVARELPGRQVTEALAAEVERADPDRQTSLILVLADRADAAALPTIQKAARSGPKKTRLAAIGALDRMANGSSVPVLLEIAVEDDAELAKAGRSALARLPGKEVDARLLASLSPAAGKLRQVLLELAGQRHMVEALPTVARYADDADAGVRSAAIGALGSLGEEKQAADLVKLLEKTQSSQDREEIEKALLAIAGRRGTACLPYLLPLTRSGDSGLRTIGLHTLSSVGGGAALAAVVSAVNDKDEAVQDEAVRTLSTWAGNWPEDTGVAEPLLTLAKSGKKTSHQVLGLRGYLEYVQGDKKLQDEQKVARIKDLLPLIKRSEEKRLAIAALSTAPTGGSLELLMTFAADSAIAEEAYLAIVSTAGKSDLKGGSKELRQTSLQTVVEKTKVDRTRRRATEALKNIR